MEEETRFEQVRTEIEAKQRAILWEDGLRNGKSVDEFLWKGDPNAKPIQRVGLVIFAITFWILGIVIFALSWAQAVEGLVGAFIGCLIGGGFVLVSIRFLFNAFFRVRKHTAKHQEEEWVDCRVAPGPDSGTGESTNLNQPVFLPPTPSPQQTSASSPDPRYDSSQELTQ